MAGRATPFRKGRSRTVPTEEDKKVAQTIADYRADNTYQSLVESNPKIVRLQYVQGTLENFLDLQSKAQQTYYPERDRLDERLPGVRHNFQTAWSKTPFVEKAAAIKITQDFLKGKLKQAVWSGNENEEVRRQWQLHRLETLRRTTGMAHRVYQRKPFASTHPTLPEELENKVAEFVGRGKLNGCGIITNGFF